MFPTTTARRWGASLPGGPLRDTTAPIWEGLLTAGRAKAASAPVPIMDAAARRGERLRGGFRAAQWWRGHGVLRGIPAAPSATSPGMSCLEGEARATRTRSGSHVINQIANVINYQPGGGATSTSERLTAESATGDLISTTPPFRCVWRTTPERFRDPARSFPNPGQGRENSSPRLDGGRHAAPHGWWRRGGPFRAEDNPVSGERLAFQFRKPSTCVQLRAPGSLRGEVIAALLNTRVRGVGGLLRDHEAGGAGDSFRRTWRRRCATRTCWRA